jgi:hypothetical protein
MLGIPISILPFIHNVSAVKHRAASQISQEVKKGIFDYLG